MTLPILGPQFLINHIQLIAFVMGVMVLVIFDEFVSGKIIFPATDFIRDFLFVKLLGIKEAKRYKRIIRYLTEFISTAVFIFYCYLGYFILGEYIIAPVLFRLQDFILLIVIIVFLLISYVYNNKKLRRKFLWG